MEATFRRMPEGFCLARRMVAKLLPYFCRTAMAQIRLSYPKLLTLLAVPMGLEPVFPP